MKTLRIHEIAVDHFALRNAFPFEFGRQARAKKIRECIRLEIAHVCDRLVFIDPAKTGKGEMPPRTVSFFPIERRFPALLVYRHPAE